MNLPECYPQTRSDKSKLLDMVAGRFLSSGIWFSVFVICSHVLRAATLPVRPHGNHDAGRGDSNVENTAPTFLTNWG